MAANERPIEDAGNDAGVPDQGQEGDDEPVPIEPEPEAPDEPYVHRGRPPDPAVQEIRRQPNPLLRAVKVLGPGLVTGAADDDPSGIGTYAQAGAQAGFGTLWLMPLLLPLMIAIQWMCARVALVTGRGLAGTIRNHFPRPVLYAVVASLVVINVLTAAADIGAMAAAAELFLPIPLPLVIVLITAGVLAMMLRGRYSAVSSVLGWLAFANLIYLVSALPAHPDLVAVLRSSLVPSLSADPAFVGIAVAVIGTTINPYLLFWQTNQEVEEQVAKGRHRLWQRQGATSAELRYRAWDVGLGMLLSQLIAFSVVVTTGATLYAHGHRNVDQLADVARELSALAGPIASALFAAGILGTGLLAIPVLLGGAAYALTDTFGQPAGLDARPTQAPLFYGVIVAAAVVAMAMNEAGINVVQALVVASLLAGVQMPPMLFLVMRIANDRSIMGQRTNGRLMNALGWGLTGLMSLAAIALVVTMVAGR